MYNEKTMKKNEIFKTPGQLLVSLLAERGWSNRLLSSVTGLEESGIGRMLSDKKPVTAEVAVILEEVFGVQAERFINLQKSFELAKARITAMPDPQRATRAQLLGELPIQEMISRNWIKVNNQKNVDEIESELTKFFHTSNLAEIEQLPHSAKKTNPNATVTLAQLAWLYRVQQIAREIIAPKYSEKKTREAIPKLKALLIAPEEARNVPKILNECGIRFLVVEALKSSKIDGVCCWLNPHSPTIALTLRYDRMDNFWFVLRHEIEHVLQGHGIRSPIIDAEIESMGKSGSNVDIEEKVANDAASEFCAPQLRIDSFIARKAPIFPERDFLGLSKVLGVHPCLVAGQIRFKTGRFDLFNSHMEKIRNCVLPSSIVDGWGDIAPI
jgi:HTH-type transcriptional regulator/antitoxin HigA